MGQLAVLDTHGLVAGEAEFGLASQRPRIQKANLGPRCRSDGEWFADSECGHLEPVEVEVRQPAVLDEDQVANCQEEKPREGSALHDGRVVGPAEVRMAQ